jgi:hypothetical protein
MSDMVKQLKGSTVVGCMTHNALQYGYIEVSYLHIYGVIAEDRP